MITAEEKFTVRRFAIDFKGPTLVIEYISSSDKVFIRKIRFKRYPPDADPEHVTKRLMSQFNDVLGPERVSKEQILEIVKILLSSASSISKTKQRGSTSAFASVLVEDKEEENEEKISAAFIPNMSSSSKVSADVVDAVDDSLQIIADLNRVSEEENLRAKNLMSITFDANAIRPGDHEYVYNKPVEFGPPEEDNDWDEDEED